MLRSFADPTANEVLRSLAPSGHHTSLTWNPGRRALFARTHYFFLFVRDKFAEQIALFFLFGF